MDKIKLILIGLGLIFTAVLVYFAVTIVMSLFWYLVFFGVVLLAGFGAYKMLSKREKPLLESGEPENELASAQKLLDKYRRELTGEKE